MLLNSDLNIFYGGKMSRSAVEKVIKKLGGTQKDLSLFCGLKSPQAVQYWKKTGVIPAKHVRKISKATGVPPCELNPLFKE